VSLLTLVVNTLTGSRSKAQFQPIDPATGQPGVDGNGLPIVGDLVQDTAVAAALAGPLKASSPDARAAAQQLLLTAVGATFPIALMNGAAVIGIKIAFLTGSGAILTVESSTDGGTTWDPKTANVPQASGALSSTLTIDGPVRIDIAGHTNLRLRVSTAGTGTATISYSASVASGVVSLGQALPPGANKIGTLQPATYSSAITFASSVGTSSEALISGGGAPTGRLELFNNGTTGTVWVNPSGGQAVVGSGIPIYPRGSYLWANGLSVVPTGISDNGVVAISGAGGY
jgi:hypothetical protein